MLKLALIGLSLFSQVAHADDDMTPTRSAVLIDNGVNALALALEKSMQENARLKEQIKVLTAPKPSPDAPKK